MTTLADADARARALRDLRSTLLVEAAAGTGKTALMAGRLTMLLARRDRASSISRPSLSPSWRPANSRPASIASLMNSWPAAYPKP